MIPNGDAMNSVARGEKTEGLLGSSPARSIFGDFMTSPSLGVFEEFGGDIAGEVSPDARRGSGLGETLIGGLCGRGESPVTRSGTGSGVFAGCFDDPAMPPRIWLNLTGVPTVLVDSTLGNNGTGGKSLFSRNDGTDFAKGCAIAVLVGPSVFSMSAWAGACHEDCLAVGVLMTGVIDDSGCHQVIFGLLQ